MPCISSCPECHRDLTVADEAAAHRRLRCPYCQAEFLAERVLADAVPVPPAAIEIDAEIANPADDQEQRQNGSPEAEAEEIAAAAQEEESAADDVEPERQQAVRVRSTPRAKASTFGLLGQMAGMVFGGILGLAIGYYILLWIGGPRADFLEIRGKLPAWLTPPNQGDRAGPLRRGAAARGLGDLLNEPDAPQPAPVVGDAPQAGNAQQAAASAAQADDAQARMDAIPASFEQPGKPPARPSKANNDRASAAASATLNGSAAVNEVEESGAAPVGPRGFNAYSIDDLEAALAKAGAALGCEYCHSTGYLLIEPPGGFRLDGPQPKRVRCDHCGGKPMPGLTAAAFDQLCQLADAATFAQLGPDDAQRERLRLQIQAALVRVGEDRGKTQIVGRLGSSRLEDSQRVSNGILLAGTVQELGPEGPLYRIKLVLFGVPKAVVVLSQNAPQPPLAQHDRVLILGSIVDSPTENLAGYAGNLTQVVWGGLPLKLVPSGP